MSDLLPLSKSINKRFKDRDKLSNLRKTIQQYFLDIYDQEITIIGFENNNLTIKVNSASLASDMYINKEKDIVQLNSIIKPKEIHRLFIKIG
jgi:hypothetical protein